MNNFFQRYLLLRVSKVSWMFFLALPLKNPQEKRFDSSTSYYVSKLNKSFRHWRTEMQQFWWYIISPQCFRGTRCDQKILWVPITPSNEYTFHFNNAAKFILEGRLSVIKCFSLWNYYAAANSKNNGYYLQAASKINLENRTFLMFQGDF